MPILHYFVWVGAGLLTLLFAADAYLPKAEQRAEQPMSYKIAVASEERLPQAVSFSGETRFFAAPVLADASKAGDHKAGDQLRNALAQADAPKPAQAEAAKENVKDSAKPTRAPKAKKIAKRKPRPQPAYAEPQMARDEGFFFPQNVAFSPAQRRTFW